MQSLLYRRACITEKAAWLQSGTGITNWGKSYHEVQQVIHYKVGQSLLESVAGVIMYNNFIAKWTNITKKTSTSSWH